MKSIFLLIIFSIFVLAITFKIVTFNKLNSFFLVVEDYTAKNSCCTYIHIFKTVPELTKVYTHNSDVMEFSSKNVIIKYENKKDIDLSIYDYKGNI